MTNLATLLFGPLAGPECRRAVARGWLILVRSLAGLALAGVALVVIWWWWVAGQWEMGHRPFVELRFGLETLEAMLLTIAVVQAPAVLAGSLAGEKSRGVLGVLMTTRATSREIVTGRLIGKLTQVAMILLAGVPPLLFLAALAGLGPGVVSTLLLVPAAVAFGGGGLAIAGSTVARRGRDALLAVYFIDLLLLIGSQAWTFTVTPLALDALLALNPYHGLSALVWEERPGPVLLTAAIWTLIGMAGLAVASWRLRPACLAVGSGERTGRSRVRRGWVPPVDEARPMLWKELFIERVSSLGGVGRWVGRLLTVGVIGGSLALTGVMVFDILVRHDVVWADWARQQLGAWVGETGTFLCYLIQWAIGLRASVSISSERERGTWDALLTSPLDAAAIVRGKLWGSLYALRWLIVAAYLAWTAAAASGAIPVADAVRWGAEVLVVGTFMAAVGVRTSLSCHTATKAMSICLGVWLGAVVTSYLVAAFLIAAGALLYNFAWIAFSYLGLAAPVTTFTMPIPLRTAWPVCRGLVYLGATALLVLDTRLRFDRIAGRMTEGAIAVAFNDLVFGRPEAPVLIEEVDAGKVEWLPPELPNEPLDEPVAERA